MKKAFFDIFENFQVIQEFMVQNLLNKVEQKFHRSKKLTKLKLLEIMDIQKQIFFYDRFSKKRELQLKNYVFYHSLRRSPKKALFRS